ncbi:MAG: AMP-binding protein [Ilumatobacteraceae bacterium]
MIVLGDLIGRGLTRQGAVDPFEGAIGDERRSVTSAESMAMLRALTARLDGASRVGVFSNHRVETYLAAVASAMSRATFAPLNPSFPAARLRRVVELADLDVIVCDSSTVAQCEELFAGVSVVNVTDVVASVVPDDSDAAWMEVQLTDEVDEGAIAYLMFTSGSTGDPKGVPVSYGSLAAYLRGITELVGIPKGLRHSQFFDLSFDLSMHDIFVSRVLDGTLVAPKPVDLMMPGAFVARERIDAWFSVPVLGALLGRSKKRDGYEGLRHMLFCGEALPMETVAACRAHLAPGGRMWNLYGPTEATIAFTAAEVTALDRSSGTAPIGLPFGDNTCALLDGETIDTNPQEGAEGELLLGGPQVFAGYSTEAPSPFVDGEGARFYRSGDLVRMERAGIEFRGRVDSQIKWRGYRIELAEIETAIRAEFGLNTVAVVLSKTTSGPTISAWCVSTECGDAPDLERLRGTLPEYMIPSTIVVLDEMPLNANGKIDRGALAKRDLP